MKLSTNFDREEFACKCGCGQDTVDAELVKVLQNVRDFFEKPIIITNANRCEKHNKEVGGSKNSQHLIGKAADIKVVGYDPEMVTNYLNHKYPDSYGIGTYTTFTHIDVRKDKARWDG